MRFQTNKGNEFTIGNDDTEALEYKECDTSGATAPYIYHFNGTGADLDLGAVSTLYCEFVDLADLERDDGEPEESAEDWIDKCKTSDLIGPY